MPGDQKDQQLEGFRRDDADTAMTTQQGVRIDDTDNSLTAGSRGPTLLEDFQLREKITHFDHERIPERVVHARGAGAYGSFTAYDSWLRDFTAAEFLTDPTVETPVFVRFSTVAGSRGSADTVRDVRGFATKFYTQQGNYDLVGNNMPVFFIQDGIKFPDLVHAVKPEPANEIPQAQSAHNTFWDFVSLQPESMHMVMWVMSDRALPRSYRMMQGFGVHTFRLVNASGQGVFVKFHWRPLLGSHSLVWDECQQLAGRDPDFHRRDLWAAIESGNYPEWELGVQLVDESDEHNFDFDLLDATKIIPEELVPVRPVGRMRLNRNPDNFFAETEQIAFHTANVVPGIDFTNDPLLQARNFSYLDTQLIRLGGPNFAQIPVNRPLAPVHNNQRDGYGQHIVHSHPTSYFPNTAGGGCPMSPGSGNSNAAEVFSHYTQRVEGHKIRERSPSFSDHFSQARLFWRSMSEVEQQHIVEAFSFELGKVTEKAIRVRALEVIGQVDATLAGKVAANVGLPAPTESPVGGGGTTPPIPTPEASSALTLIPPLAGFDAPAPTVATRRIAVLVADGLDAEATSTIIATLGERGAITELIAPRDGTVTGSSGAVVEVGCALSTTASVLYDAVLVAGGQDGVSKLAKEGAVLHFVAEAYKHHKPVGAWGAGVDLLREARLTAQLAEGAELVSDAGVVTVMAVGDEVPPAFVEQFEQLVAAHRVWNRETTSVPA